MDSLPRRTPASLHPETFAPHDRTNGIRLRRPAAGSPAAPAPGRLRPLAGPLRLWAARAACFPPVASKEPDVNVNGTHRPARKRPRPAPLNVEIREMELRDLPAVFGIGQKIFTAEKLPTLYRSWDEHEIVTLFGSDEETCLVAEARVPDRIVGFALGRMMEKPGSAWRYGWLEWLGVEPLLKRTGIASRLVRRLTERFIERDARIMLVDTDEDNADALAFFRQSGFGQERRHVYLSQNLDDHPLTVERRNSERNGRAG